MSAITHIAADAPPWCPVAMVRRDIRQAPAQASPERLNGSQKKPPSSGAYGPADRVCVSPPAAESVMAPLAKRCRISSWACR
jgi:hypothetical protein